MNRLINGDRNMAELNEKKEKEIPDLEVLFDLADLFKVFGRRLNHFSHPLYFL